MIPAVNPALLPLFVVVPLLGAAALVVVRRRPVEVAVMLGAPLLVALGALILAGAVPQWEWVHMVGLASLWAAAILTLVTGWDYLRVGLKHMD